MRTGIYRSLKVEGTISSTGVFVPYDSDIGCARPTPSPSGTTEKLAKQANGKGGLSFGQFSVDFATGYLTYLVPSTRLTVTAYGSSTVNHFAGIQAGATFSIEIATEVVYYHYPISSPVYPVGNFPVVSGEPQVPQRCHVFGDLVYAGAPYTVTITSGGQTAAMTGTVPTSAAGYVFGVKQPNSGWIPYRVNMAATIFASEAFNVWAASGGTCNLVEAVPQQTGFVEIQATLNGIPIHGDSVNHSQTYAGTFPYTATGNINFGSGVRCDAKGAVVSGAFVWDAAVEYEARATFRSYLDPYGASLGAYGYKDGIGMEVAELLTVGDGLSPTVQREYKWSGDLYGKSAYKVPMESDGFSSRLGTVAYTGPSGFALALQPATGADGDPNGDQRMFIRLPIADAIKFKQTAEILLDDGSSLTGWTGATLGP